MPSIDLTAHVRLRLAGEDRVRYLNGQVTNDARKISQTEMLCGLPKRQSE